MSASPQLRSAVGRSAVNHRADVRLVQKLLNQQIRPPLRYLKEDGIFGNATAGALRRFQTSACRMHQPTEHIDPGDATFKTLVAAHMASPGSPVAAAVLLAPTVTPVAEGLEKNADVVREEFAKEHKESEFAEFWKTVVVESNTQISKIFGGISTAEKARMLAVIYLRLRGVGLAATDIKNILKAVAGAGPTYRMKLIEALAEPVGGCGRFLKGLNSAGEKLEYISLIIEVSEAWGDEDWGKGAGKIYEFTMGKLVPWGGLIDSVESLLPNSWKGSRVVNILRAMNPVGLGGVAIDSIVTVINYAVGSTDERQLDRLVARMREGPARVFAEFGDHLRLGDALFDFFHPADAAARR